MIPMSKEFAGPHAIATRALEKRFGRTRALAGVDLTVPEGSVYVLVGPNGVGKTTTLEVLLGLVAADSGTAEVLGIDTRAEPARVRAQIGWVPEKTDAVYGWLPVGKVIRYHAAFHSSWDEDYAAELTRLFELDPEERFGRISKGKQRRVQLLLALAHKPPVLLMDEPTDGLDPVMRERTLSALADHMARFPTTILMSTHRVNEAERLGDHLGVMRSGRIETQLDRETLRRYLRAYSLQVPDGWRGAPELANTVLVRNGSPREVAWTIWGDETEVAQRLHSAGATIRQVQPLSLEDAALVLLSREDLR
jgi:ABC-2 type transport system ATP-binding protein